MAIAGGPVQTLLSGMAVAHFGLDRSVLYYSPGNSILSVPTSGGACSEVVSAASAITAMHPLSATDGHVYLAEGNGSVALGRARVHRLQGRGIRQRQCPVLPSPVLRWTSNLTLARGTGRLRVGKCTLQRSIGRPASQMGRPGRFDVRPDPVIPEQSPRADLHAKARSSTRMALS